MRLQGVRLGLRPSEDHFADDPMIERRRLGGRIAVTPRSFARALALVLTTGTLACSGPIEVSFQFRSAFEPPPEYFVWYWATEQCSSLSGDMRRVRWYVAASIVTNGVIAVATWSRPHDITIRRGSERDGFVVKHEMLHDLLNGDPFHTSPAWDLCGLRSARLSPG